MARARLAGYWQAKVLPAVPEANHYVRALRLELGEFLPPLRFEDGERMQLTRASTNLLHDDMTHYLVEWHFVGRSVAMHMPQDWLAKAGTVRAIAAPTNTTCKGGQPCPKSGIWQPVVMDKENPLSKVLNEAPLSEGWKWQAFVPEGQTMPSLKQQGMEIEDAKVDWRLMQATETGFDV